MILSMPILKEILAHSTNDIDFPEFLEKVRAHRDFEKFVKPHRPTTQKVCCLYLIIFSNNITFIFRRVLEFQNI